MADIVTKTVPSNVTSLLVLDDFDRTIINAWDVREHPETVEVERGSSLYWIYADIPQPERVLSPGGRDDVTVQLEWPTAPEVPSSTRTDDWAPFTVDQSYSAEIDPHTTVDFPEESPILRYFAFAHLPAGPLRDTSELVCELARDLDAALPNGPEKSAGLRKLLEAKDCFVRAALE